MRQIVAENALTVDTVWHTLEAFPVAGRLDLPLKTLGGYAIGTDNTLIVISDKVTAGVRSMVSFVLPNCKVMLIKPPFETLMWYPRAGLVHRPFSFRAPLVSQEFALRFFATTYPC